MIVVILENKEKEDSCSVKFEQHSPETILRDFEIILICYFYLFRNHIISGDMLYRRRIVLINIRRGIRWHNTQVLIQPYSLGLFSHW